MRIRDKESRVLRDSRRTWLRYSQRLQSEGIAASKSCLRPTKKRTKADTLWAPKRGSPPKQRPEADPMNPVTVLPETTGSTKRQQRRTDPSIGGERRGQRGDLVEFDRFIVPHALGLAALPLLLQPGKATGRGSRVTIDTPLFRIEMNIGRASPTLLRLRRSIPSGGPDAEGGGHGGMSATTW